MKNRWLVFTFLLISAAVQAQEITTNSIDITLVDCENPPEKLDVVLDGKDSSPYSISRDPKNPCHYSGKIPEPPFTLHSTPISVRLGGARSECRVARDLVDPADKNLSIGQLAFRYKPGKARDVEIDLQPLEFGLHYVREYHPNYAGEDDIVPCREGWRFSGTYSIKDVLIPGEGETLTLQLLPPAGEIKPIAVDKRIWDQAAKRSAELKADDMGAAYLRQYCRGSTETPRICVEMQSAFSQNLKDKGFGHLTLKVK